MPGVPEVAERRRAAERTPAMSDDLWLTPDFDAAEAAGWNIYEKDDGSIAIERSDDAMQFITDQDAIAFVTSQAAAGDPLAAKAIRIVLGLDTR